MTYLSPKERIKISLYRSEVEESGKPFYTGFNKVPPGLLTKTACKKAKMSVKDGEEPVAYVLSRDWNGYLPLYDRRE
ncbi:MAG: hypothetical protein A4E56_00370 [Pelotomaculum sp. PtaU1.Bin065]|nr:MAG: hypothetical protein A4E56_00370 [Pelotomaculum sp. PtaU1.Bin065]